MTRALVLGGGGPVGIAWQIGVLAGLAEAGLDLADADRIVGTSAGAVVGALLARHRSAATVFEAHHALAERHEARVAPAPDLAPLMQFMLRRPPVGFPSDSLLAEVGAYACRATTMPEAAFLAIIGGFVPPGGAWPASLLCTTVDAGTGAFTVWDAAAAIDLSHAVAASCAVPGVYPPVTLQGRPHVDGGVRSATNADLATDCRVAVVLAVTIEPFAAFMAAAAERELAAVAAQGVRTALVVPDAATLAAFGPSLMATDRRVPIAEAGRRQGLALAERLAIWRG